MRRLLWVALVWIACGLWWCATSWAETIASDSFTESVDTVLTSHTSDTGGTWAISNTNLGVSASTDKVKSISSNAGGEMWGAQSVTIGSDQMAVTLVCTNVVTAGRKEGPAGRIPSGENGSANAYWAVIANDSVVTLRKRIASSDTSLGTYTHSGNDATLKLDLQTAAKQVYVDGISQISSTDDNLTGNNFAGIYVEKRTDLTGDDFLSETISTSQTQYYLMSKVANWLMGLEVFAEDVVTPTLVRPLTDNLSAGYYLSTVCGTGVVQHGVDEDGNQADFADPRHPCLADDAGIKYWVLVYDEGTSMVIKALVDAPIQARIPDQNKARLDLLSIRAKDYLAQRGEGKIGGR